MEFFVVDPRRFALLSPLAKGRILLDKLRARVHGGTLAKYIKQIKPREGLYLLASG